MFYNLFYKRNVSLLIMVNTTFVLILKQNLNRLHPQQVLSQRVGYRPNKSYITDVGTLLQKVIIYLYFYTQSNIHLSTEVEIQLYKKRISVKSTQPVNTLKENKNQAFARVSQVSDWGLQYTLKEHQSFLSFATFQKILIKSFIMGVYENFFISKINWSISQ